MYDGEHLHHLCGFILRRVWSYQRDHNQYSVRATTRTHWFPMVNCLCYAWSSSGFLSFFFGGGDNMGIFLPWFRPIIFCFKNISLLNEPPVIDTDPAWRFLCHILPLIFRRYFRGNVARHQVPSWKPSLTTQEAARDLPWRTPRPWPGGCFRFTNGTNWFPAAQKSYWRYE